MLGQKFGGPCMDGIRASGVPKSRASETISGAPTHSVVSLEGSAFRNSRGPLWMRTSGLSCCWLRRPVNAQNRHADFIGIYGVFVTSGAEYIGAVGVPGVCKFTISASAETLGIYGVSFACSTETLGICGVFATSTGHNPMTSMV